MNNQQILESIKKKWEEPGGVIPTLEDYIRIPNMSPMFDDKWNTNDLQMKVVAMFETWARKRKIPGMTLEVIKDPARTPLLFFEIPGTLPNAPTVLMYGHMDKQPPCEGWRDGLGPYTPVIKDGKLYGRGGADDGYAMFASLTAIEAVLEQSLPIPRIVLIVEACEESGSRDLPFYVEQLSARIGDVSLVVCLDSGCGNYEQLWLTTSLRGLCVGTLRVSILEEGVHSGLGSGIVPDTTRIARVLLDRLDDPVTGKVRLPDLYVQVPAVRMEQAVSASQVLGQTVYSEFTFVSGSRPVHDDVAELLLNRTWRPQLTVTGAGGFPSVELGGNVLRAWSSFKLSMRLPPTLDPAKASAVMKRTLEDSPPYGAHVVFEGMTASPGWNAPKMEPWLHAFAEEASREYYKGKALQLFGEGGSIPFMGMLGKRFPRAQFIIAGVLGPGSNAHGPNEFMHIDFAERLTCCVAYCLTKFASHHAQ